jgi:plasmid maintenance system antidote protein VapI
MGTKQARNFGGRPVEREPEPGKRTHLTIALPLPLKRRVEREAVKQGRSISNEAALRLERSFETEKLLADFARLLTEVTLDAVRGQDPREAVLAKVERGMTQLLGAKGGDKK